MPLTYIRINMMDEQINEYEYDAQYTQSYIAVVDLQSQSPVVRERNFCLYMCTKRKTAHIDTRLWATKKK